MKVAERIKRFLLILIFNCSFRNGNCKKHWEKINEVSPYGDDHYYHCHKCNEPIV